MKKVLALMLVLIVASFPMTFVLAQGTTPCVGVCSTSFSTPVNFTLAQMTEIGVIASALTAFFRLLLEWAMKKKFDVPDWVMILIVYVVSFAAAVWWFPQAMPTLPIFAPTDPVTWVPAIFGYLGNLLVALTAYAVVAGAVYLLLIQKVKDGLGSIIIPTAYTSASKK